MERVSPINVRKILEINVRKSLEMVELFKVATEEERNAMIEMAVSKLLEDVEETEKDAQDAINDYYIGGV